MIYSPSATSSLPLSSPWDFVSPLKIGMSAAGAFGSSHNEHPEKQSGRGCLLVVDHSKGLIVVMWLGKHIYIHLPCREKNWSEFLQKFKNFEHCKKPDWWMDGWIAFMEWKKSQSTKHSGMYRGKHEYGTSYFATTTLFVMQMGLVHFDNVFCFASILETNWTLFRFFIMIRKKFKYKLGISFRWVACPLTFHTIIRILGARVKIPGRKGIYFWCNDNRVIKEKRQK